MGKIELKPCPFCGGEAELIDDSGRHGKVYSVYHQCPRNGGKFNRYGSVCTLTIDTGWYDTAEEATEAWNTRALPIPDTPEIVRALDDAYEAGRKSTERTCTIKQMKEHEDGTTTYYYSCGHVHVGHSQFYCDRCGAKVI